MTRSPSRKRGFSLLEVMVAIAILGLALSVILGAQGGLAASNRTAANLGTASSLVRCKMTEVEEKLMREGFQELDSTDYAVSCCDTLDQDAFKCDIKVERVVLPDTQGADGGAAMVGQIAAIPGVGGAGPTGGGTPPPGGAAADPVGALLGGDGGIGGAIAGAGGADGLVSMAMGMVYPSLKPMLEASIRRVTVAVRWKEGPKERDLTITQFVTNPMRGGLVGGAMAPDGGAIPGLGSSSSSSGGTGTSSSGGAGTSSGAGRSPAGGIH